MRAAMDILSTPLIAEALRVTEGKEIFLKLVFQFDMMLVQTRLSEGEFLGGPQGVTLDAKAVSPTDSSDWNAHERGQLTKKETGIMVCPGGSRVSM